MLDNERGRRIRGRYIIIPAIVLLSLVCGGAAYFYGIIRGGEHDAAAIAVADSISRADSIAMARQLRRMQQIAEDSTMYESERAIAPRLLDKWDPGLKKWLDFRRI